MPQKFLDTKVIYEGNQIKTKVHRNERKLPVHWTSKIRKRYKWNAINADLNRATRIASTYAEDIVSSNSSMKNVMVTPKMITLYRQTFLMSLNR